MGEALNEFEELAEYLGVPSAEVLSKAQGCQAATRDDWLRANPLTDYQILDWYKTSDKYLYELAAWHSDPARVDLSDWVISHLQGKTVLDFGAGIGSDSIRMARAGYHVTYCDLPSPVMSYALWRFWRRPDLPIYILDDGVESPLSRELYLYDNIVCIDVLEHLKDVPACVGEFYEHLNPGGHFLWDACWDQQEVFPCHLSRNLIYRSEFPALLESIGFEVLESHRWARKP